MLPFEEQSYADDQADLKAYQKELKQLKKQIGKAQKDLISYQKSYSKTEKELLEVNQSLAKILSQIKQTQQEIAEQNTALELLSKQLTESQASLSKQQDEILILWQALYQKGQISILKLMLQQGEQNPMQMSKYFEYIHQSWLQKLQALKQEQLQIERQQAQMIQLKESLLSANEALKKKQQKTESLSKEKKRLVAKLQKSIGTTKQQVNQKNKRQKQLNELMNKLEKNIQAKALSKTNAKFVKQKGQLNWPLKGKLVKRFGDLKSGSSLKWQGVLIAAKEGSEVRAVHPGVVAFNDWLIGYGLLVIVNHGDGYWSLYAFNQSSLVEPSQQVKKGQILAYSGTGPDKEVPGLYFEVRRHNKAIDPLKWLE